MSLITNLVRLWSQGQPVEDSTVSGMLADVEAHYEVTGPRAHRVDVLSMLTGAPSASVYAWYQDVHHVAELPDVEALRREARVARLPDNDLPDSLTINAGDHHGRHTTISTGLDLAPGTMASAIEVYLTGDYLGAARALVDGVRDTYYHNVLTKTLANDQLDL